MKKQLIIGIIVTLLVVGITGCTENSSDDRSKFIGKWLSNQSLVFFYSNGTFDVVGLSDDGTWELRDGQLIMQFLSGSEEIVDYSFSNDYDTLTLSRIDDQGNYEVFDVFTRQYEEQKLFGTWKRENGDLELTLNNNGTYVWGNFSGTYEYDNDKLYLNFGDIDLTYGYGFSDYNIILNLTYLDTGEYERYIKQP